MNGDAILDFLEETERPAPGTHPAPLRRSAPLPCATTARAWDLLRRLQGHPYGSGYNHPGSHNVDDVTVDWLVHAISPEDWRWLAENFDYRRQGWPTVSLLDRFLRARCSQA
jgi:hypothetical protein